MDWRGATSGVGWRTCITFTNDYVFSHRYWNRVYNGMTYTDAFAAADESSFPSRLFRDHDLDRAPCTATELALQEEKKGPGPLVSVILPTYRDCQYLPDALESVNAQTYGNIEVILVDSSGVPWVKRLADERDWIRYVSMGPQGVSAARNEGIESASGDYIALLDADDYWRPEKLERQITAMERGWDASFTCYYFVNFRNEGNSSVTTRDSRFDSPETAHIDTLTGKIKPHTSTLVFRSSSVPDRPFDESLSHFEDILFAVELFRDHPPVHLSEPLSVRRLRDGSLADRTSRDVITESRVHAYGFLAEQYPELEPYAERMKASEEYTTAWWYLRRGENQRARHHVTRSLRHIPRNPKAITLYLATLLPVDGASTSRTIETVCDVVSDHV